MFHAAGDAADIVRLRRTQGYRLECRYRGCSGCDYIQQLRQVLAGFGGVGAATVKCAATDVAAVWWSSVYVEVRLMRKSGWTLRSCLGAMQHVYLVVDDLGRLGRVWREVDVEMTDLET
jgi:hypothetical protein